MFLSTMCFIFVLQGWLRPSGGNKCMADKQKNATRKFPSGGLKPPTSYGASTRRKNRYCTEMSLFIRARWAVFLSSTSSLTLNYDVLGWPLFQSLVLLLGATLLR